jgi:hypothetical protein
MSSFLRTWRRQPEVHGRPVIDFVHEQDGPREQRFKESLRDELRSSGVKRAYLVRITYGDPDGREVALCLVGQEDPAIVAQVRSVVAHMFGTGSQLDIMFLSRTQETRVAVVCRPFFVS